MSSEHEIIASALRDRGPGIYRFVGAEDLYELTRDGWELLGTFTEKRFLHAGHGGPHRDVSFETICAECRKPVEPAFEKNQYGQHVQVGHRRAQVELCEVVKFLVRADPESKLAQVALDRDHANNRALEYQRSAQQSAQEKAAIEAELADLRARHEKTVHSNSTLISEMSKMTDTCARARELERIVGKAREEIGGKRWRELFTGEDT